MILSVFNNKGGVAKTTTAVNLSAALATTGRRVLLVDTDAQASASLSLGVPIDQLRPSLADVLFAGVPIADVVRSPSPDGVAIVPASIDLTGSDVAITETHATGRERLLSAALAPIAGYYDFVVVDCPPAFSLLSINALVASDALVVPVVPHYLALEGLVSLLDAIESIRATMQARAEIMGILATVVDYRVRSTHEIMTRMRQTYGRRMFATEIRTNSKVAEAPAAGVPVTRYAPGSTGARAYTELAREVQQRAKRITC